jgi:hypothetical protein
MLNLYSPLNLTAPHTTVLGFDDDLHPPRVHGTVTFGAWLHLWKLHLIGINPDPPFAPYSPLLTFPARLAIPSARGPVVAPAALSEGMGILQP